MRPCVYFAVALVTGVRAFPLGFFPRYRTSSLAQVWLDQVATRRIAIADCRDLSTFRAHLLNEEVASAI
jgi:hypothetical protein